MKLLVALPESPYPWSSTAARYYGPMLRELDRLGHDVTVVAVRSSVGQREEPAAYFDGTRFDLRFVDPPVPRPFLERKARSLWRSGWDLAASPFGDAVRREASGTYDGIIAEQVSTARALEGDPRVLCTLQCLRHVDLDAEPTTIGGRLRRLQVRREEATTLRRVGVVRVFSRDLAGHVARLAPRARTRIVPLCIDPDLYAPVAQPAVDTVGVVGSMFWQPSRAAAIHFVEQLVPRLRAARPSLKFLVAGWQAGRYIGSRAAAAGVEVIENFTSPRDVFARLSVMTYMPPAGTGMKVKVLEAMAYGVPVVANSSGAEGLDADSDNPVRPVNDDAEACRAILRLLTNRRARVDAIDAGRAVVRRSFSPAAVVPAMLGCFHA